MSSGESQQGPRRFPTTEWLLVTQLRSDEPPAIDQALSKLCQRYWWPIYGFISMHTRSAEEAEDLTQRFMIHMLRHRSFANAERSSGRFRSFIVGALKHFLADEERDRRRLKRAGDQEQISLDALGSREAERLAIDHSAEDLAEKDDRARAEQYVVRALNSLALTYDNRGKRALFLRLRAFLSPATVPDACYETASRDLNRPVATVRNDVRRLRAEYRALFRREVARAVGPEELENELRRLIKLLCR